MKWQHWFLPLILGSSLSLTYLLPENGQAAHSAMMMQLPPTLDDWQFKIIPPSKEEIHTLQKDTQFSKAVCLKPRAGERNANHEWIPDRLDVSIVLSGHDLNNSIHRPERCMPAQGHTIISSHDVTFSLYNGKTLPAKCLESTQTLVDQNDKTKKIQLHCLTYYFFVGHQRITADHFQRTWFDISDRLISGIDQRWAYVSISMWYGKIPWIEPLVSKDEAAHKMQTFIKAFASDQIHWPQIQP